MVSHTHGHIIGDDRHGYCSGQNEHQDLYDVDVRMYHVLESGPSQAYSLCWNRSSNQNRMENSSMNSVIVLMLSNHIQLHLQELWSVDL